MKSRKGVDNTPEIAAWRAANPIRRWVYATGGAYSRDPTKNRLRQLCREFGVTRQMVYYWMDGSAMPFGVNRDTDSYWPNGLDTPEFVALLARIHCSARRYMKWWESMPSDQGVVTCDDTDSVSTR